MIVSLTLGTPLLGGCVVATSSRSTGGGGGGLFLLFFPVLLLVLMARLMRGGRRTTRPVMDRRSRVQAEASEPSLAMIRAELSVLADDVVRLEPQVAIDERARDDYEAAALRYRVASAALDQDADRIDLARVQRVVDEANWSMARARAALQGRPAPAPPASLQRPGPRGEPAVRLDERENPTYDGSDETFRSGWFGGGGLVGGTLLGPMLGGWIIQTGDADERRRGRRRR